MAGRSDYTQHGVLNHTMNRMSIEDDVFDEVPYQPRFIRQASLTSRIHSTPPAHNPTVCRRTTIGRMEDLNRRAGTPPVLRKMISRQESFSSQVIESSDDDSIANVSGYEPSSVHLYHHMIKIESPRVNRRYKPLSRSATFDQGSGVSAEKRYEYRRSKASVLNRTVPLTGHEHPYSIWMSHLRDERKNGSMDRDEVVLPMEMDMNDNSVQCQFILRETKKVHKKISIGK